MAARRCRVLHQKRCAGKDVARRWRQAFNLALLIPPSKSTRNYALLRSPSPTLHAPARRRNRARANVCSARGFTSPGAQNSHRNRSRKAQNLLAGRRLACRLMRWDSQRPEHQFEMIRHPESSPAERKFSSAIAVAAYLNDHGIPSGQGLSRT
jgi:hypothetical protein